MDFSRRVTELINSVPHGKVATYGQIARLAGNRRGARLVSYLLHSLSEKYDLPWYRVVNRSGKISLKPGYGYELQRQLLENEGIMFGNGDAIDLDKYGWQT
ncbi:MAG: MGMT family protein [Spirochaetales bacterium]|nr:MGMT family protein [Spirochaetales bacterium]